jgi:hypothetical protein
MNKDYFGKELNIGDEVVYMRINYRDLRKAKIIRMGPKKATIEYLSGKIGRSGKTTQFYNQLIKIDK